MTAPAAPAATVPRSSIASRALWATRPSRGRRRGDSGKTGGVLERCAEAEAAQRRQQSGRRIQGQPRQDQAPARGPEAPAAEPGRVRRQPAQGLPGFDPGPRQHDRKLEFARAVGQQDRLEPPVRPVAGRQVGRPHRGDRDRAAGRPVESERRGPVPDRRVAPTAPGNSGRSPAPGRRRGRGGRPASAPRPRSRARPSR